MNWQELRRKWNEDPEWVQAFEEEYPFREVALAVVGLRAELGLSQARLAELVGTQQSVISRLESGQHSAEIDILNRIAKAVRMAWRPVFGEAEEPALEPVVEHSEVHSAEPIILAEPQSSPLFLPIDIVGVIKNAHFIPSPARFAAGYEVVER
jgi:transcriptional regulator with XRE-family HTH domain